MVLGGKPLSQYFILETLMTTILLWPCLRKAEALHISL